MRCVTLARDRPFRKECNFSSYKYVILSRTGHCTDWNCCSCEVMNHALSFHSIFSFQHKIVEPYCCLPLDVRGTLILFPFVHDLILHVWQFWWWNSSSFRSHLPSSFMVSVQDRTLRKVKLWSLTCPCSEKLTLGDGKHLYIRCDLHVYLNLKS